MCHSQVLQYPSSAADVLFIDGHLGLQPPDIRYSRPPTFGRVVGLCLRTGRPLIVRRLVRDGRYRVGVLLDLKLHYPLVRFSQVLVSTLCHDPQVMGLRFCDLEVLPQLRHRRLLELHLGKEPRELLLEGIVTRLSLIALRPRLCQQHGPGI